MSINILQVQLPVPFGSYLSSECYESAQTGIFYINLLTGIFVMKLCEQKCSGVSH
jgi:hypothetical protein